MRPFLHGLDAVGDLDQLARGEIDGERTISGDLHEPTAEPTGGLGRCGEPRTAPRYQATKSSYHETNKAFEGRNYKPRRKYCSAKIKQFTQGFALLFIKP